MHSVPHGEKRCFQLHISLKNCIFAELRVVQIKTITMQLPSKSSTCHKENCVLVLQAAFDFLVKNIKTEFRKRMQYPPTAFSILFSTNQW